MTRADRRSTLSGCAMLRTMAKQRLDQALVERGLAASRAQAQALVLAGEVVVDGRVARRSADPIAPEAVFGVKDKPRFVSRGGLKLEHALERFGINVEGLVVADLGASTGGFTDCLLQRGARRVYAIDVGHGQLNSRLRSDPRVVAMEKVNARDLRGLAEPVDLLTADLSFISLTRVLDSAKNLLGQGAEMVVLLKPQFEAGRAEVKKGGVVRDQQTLARIVGRFLNWATNHGLALNSLALSPIRGPAGNSEFLLHLAPY
jgi:23S rRNA (cytidine1920-2'-O)/16S rRNA (cytidine1409-2'-O)-methyltransferase